MSDTVLGTEDASRKPKQGLYPLESLLPGGEYLPILGLFLSHQLLSPVFFKPHVVFLS